MKEILGDILTPVTNDEAVVVCQQVNCCGVMGAGLARQIKNRFPYVYSAYLKKCREEENNLGTVQIVSCVYSAGYIIANCFGQDNFGTDKQYTDYEALRKCFIYLNNAFSNTTIRIPYKIGCGLGGGDWEVVLSIIDECFNNSTNVVEIWRLDK